MKIFFIIEIDSLEIEYFKTLEILINYFASRNNIIYISSNIKSLVQTKKVFENTKKYLSNLNNLNNLNIQWVEYNYLIDKNIFYDEFNKFILEKNFNMLFIFGHLLNVTNILKNINNSINIQIYTYLCLTYCFFKTKIIELINNKTNKIIVSCEYWKNHLCKMNIQDNKILIIPYCFDNENISFIDECTAKKYFNFNPDDFIILNSNSNYYSNRIDKTIDVFLKFIKIKQFSLDIKLFLDMNSDDTNTSNSYDILNQIKVGCIKYNIDYNNIVCNHIFINKNNLDTQLDLEKQTNINYIRKNYLYNCCDVGLCTYVGGKIEFTNLQHAKLSKPQIIGNLNEFGDIFNNDCGILVNLIESIYLPSNLNEEGGFENVFLTDDYVEGLIKYYDNRKLMKIHGKKSKEIIEQKYNQNKINEIIRLLFDDNDELSNNIVKYNTKYGIINMYQNELYIGNEFKNGRYWEENILLKLKQYIDPSKNILEIGAHCGTSTIFYANILNSDNLVYAVEPQKNQYDLLVKNIYQNNLQDKIKPYNFALFCFEGLGNMNNIDIDGGGGNFELRYTSESNLYCNFGGACLGKKGEKINLKIIDNLDIDNIGFIHCDAQGSENYIFSKGTGLLNKYRPVIYYENNNYSENLYLYEQVNNTYPEYNHLSLFDVKQYCLNILNYKICIDRFEDSNNTLLIP
jgi:FkbM family methyltransferase